LGKNVSKLIMKNILITGGAGFIGSHLALALMRKGHHVTVLDNLSPQIHGASPASDSALYRSVFGKLDFILGNVTEYKDWEKAINGQDVIIHLAAETGTGQSMYEVSRYSEVNSLGTARMLDVLVNRKHHVSKVIVASSRAVYGEGKYLHPVKGAVYPESRDVRRMESGDFNIYDDDTVLQPLPTDENSLLHPLSVYGITKLSQEQLVQTVCSALEIPSVILRYQNVYGEGQSLLNPYTGILSIFSSQILQGKNICIFEDGKESRDFVHIQDVTEATLLCVESEKADNEIFNIGTGKATDVFTVASHLIRNYGNNVEAEVTGQFRIGDIRHNYADISKIEYCLGFHPTITFAEGMQRFTRWVAAQDIRDVKFRDSLEEMKSKGLLK